ncbi:MAG TPA: acyl-CoA thioesterase II [Candidatus Binatia bacterium]|nr:acyl-CoA thioesterase II [Candidatus Binatia bacterium]
MQEQVDQLIETLDLEELDLNIFRGRSPEESRIRVFGGQVAGQALVAAGRTVVPELRVHSLHAYFLRPGDPKIPIVYEVDRIRDGKSFTTRRVVAIQRGRAIFHLSASFQVVEDGPSHQLPMPEVPAPESLPTWAERMTARMEDMSSDMKEWFLRPRPIELRYVEPPKRERHEPRQLIWIRADGALPDSPLLHQCVVAYASDMTLLDTATLPHGIYWNDPRYQMASLDHAMWFHRPFRADDWLLYAQESPSASGARGLCTGHLFARDGRLVVTVVQEGLVRPIAPRG